MSGIFYGVGIGPGDPELLTIRATRAIREAQAIAVPHTGGGRTVALDIARDYIGDKPVIELDIPMTRDQKVLQDAYRAAAHIIMGYLSDNQNVAFLTLGDVSLYSTFADLQRYVEECGYEVALIPGVPAVCAVAARLKRPLAEGSEALCIIPAIAQNGFEQIAHALQSGQNVAVMKAGSKLGALKKSLAEQDYLSQTVMVERCGLEGERIVHDFSQCNEESGYFSTVLIRSKGVES